MRCADCGGVYLGSHHYCSKSNIERKTLAEIHLDYLGGKGAIFSWEEVLNMICAELEDMHGVKNVCIITKEG